MSGQDAATATLLVGSWSSSCSACKRGADPSETHHMTILGYGPANGSPGCGALFIDMDGTYPDMDAALKRLRPDLPIAHPWPSSVQS